MIPIESWLWIYEINQGLANRLIRRKPSKLLHLLQSFADGQLNMRLRASVFVDGNDVTRLEDE